MSTVTCYLNESGMLNLSAAKAIQNTDNKGCITIIPTSSGSRIRLNASLYADLEKPKYVEFFELNGSLIISQARDGLETYKVGKGDIIYNSSLAKSVAVFAGVEPEDKSLSVGSYEIAPVDETHKGAVIIFNNSPVEKKGEE